MSWEEQSWREDDWCEVEECRTVMELIPPDHGAFLYEMNPSSKKYM